MLILHQRRYGASSRHTPNVLPVGLLIGAVGLLLGLLAAGVACAGATYYVSTTGDDANSGMARTNAWRTIQSAVDRVGPGDSIIVLAGTYTGALIRATGTTNAPITLKADEGAAVLLNARNPIGHSTHNSILWIEDWNGLGPVSHWIIQGFEIAGSMQYGIDIRGRTNQNNSGITILSNRVHHSALTGIFTAFSDDLLIAGNESYSNGEHGVYCSNSGDRPVVRGNRLHHNAGCGLHMNGDVTQGGDGIISGGLVEDNQIYRNGTNGAGVNMDGVEGTRVRNNLIFASPNNSGIALFRQNGAVPSRGNAIVNNTVIMNSNTTSRCGWALTITAGANSNAILNNIFYSYDPIRGAIAMPAVGITGMVCNFNTVMNRFSSDGGDSTIDLAAWRAYGYDSNSIMATPAQLFADLAADDYHLTSNSPAIDKGTLPIGVATDIEGGPRLQGSAVDIGAYEAVSPSNWTIVVEATTNGTILPSGFVVVPRNGGTNFLIQGTPHYHISAIRTNQAVVNAYGYDNSCTNVLFAWNAIATNGFLSALFSENQWHGVPETWLAWYYPATVDYYGVASSDTDGDGHAAWQEYYAGTDPTASGSVLRITQVDIQGGSNHVVWLGGKGGSPLSFHVFRGTSLVETASWSNVADVVKDGTGTNSWRDAAAGSSPQIFYKITVTSE